MIGPLKHAVLTQGQGGGASGPYPAPAGYRWAYVLAFGQPVTAFGQTVVSLVHI